MLHGRPNRLLWCCAGAAECDQYPGGPDRIIHGGTIYVSGKGIALMARLTRSANLPQSLAIMDQGNLPVPSIPSESQAFAPSQISPNGGRFSFADGDPDHEEGGGGGIKRILGAVLYYKWLVLGLTVAGCVAGVLVSRQAKLSYQAEARLWVAGVPDRNAQMQGPIQSPELLRGRAWLELLGSYAVLDPVVQQHRLHLRFRAHDRDVMAGFHADSGYTPGSYFLLVDEAGTNVELHEERVGRIERVSVGSAIGRELGMSWAPAAASLTPNRRVDFRLVHPRTASRYITQSIEASIAGDNFLMLRFSNENADMAASILNTLATQYLEVAADLKRAQLEEFRDILERQLTYSEENLRQAELALESFRVQTITLPSDQATPINPGIEATRAPALSGYFQLSIDREALQRDRDAIQRLIANAVTEPVSVDALTSIPTVARSPELMQALTELTTGRANVRALGQQYTDEHPLMRQALEHVNRLQASVIPQLAGNVVASLDSRLGEMDRLVASAAGDLRAIPPRAIDEARLTRAVQSAAALYNELRGRYESARLATETTIPDVRVLDYASVPQFPANNPRIQIILLAFVGSLGLGIGLAILLERMDPRLRYPEQVSDGFRLTILGALPNLARTRRGSRAVDRAEIIEALRGIRLSLQNAYGTAGPMMVTISSPGPGDGKTFLSTNLGLAFAELGRKTLIIDGDTRRGTMHRLLNLERTPGLTDFLAGRASIDEIIRETDSPDLHVIPCGTRLAASPDLLSSPRMGLLLARIRSAYQVILFDSPPLGAGVDPLVLSTVTGNMVVVFRTLTTNRAVAEAKLAMLNQLPVRVLGAVVNGVRSEVGYRYYSYLPGYVSENEDPGKSSRLLEPA